MYDNVLNYLEHSACLFPDKTAAEDGKLSCNYADLLAKSKAIGSYLAEEIHLVKNAPVAVFMEKGVDALCAFFGTVYAGGFYCLLNPEFPEKRLHSIMSVLRSSVIITDSELYEKAVGLFPDCNVLKTEDLLKHKVNETVILKIRDSSVDTDPLYVNFTSGSTGTPKGIAVSHRSVIDFIGHFTKIFGITQDDIIANQAPFDFDVSVKDIYSSLCVGATLVIVPRKLFSAPAQLIDFLCEHRITTMIWAVSALCLISTFHGLDYKTPETVNKILFSGEVMPFKHLNTWRSHLPNAVFVNLYGPTEITCNCTYHILSPNEDYADGIPIGKHFPNEDVFLLNDEDRKVEQAGEVGEICVRGTALALGYYNMPFGQRNGFVQNPLNTCYHELIYRTGDLGRYAENGDLFFCGRKDFQIKHMGHRIELEEIDREISSVDGVERCCCIFDAAKERLIAYYVGSIDKKELYSHLKSKLPVFMVPGALRQVESMPLTKNGKIDRAALTGKGGEKH